MQVAATLKDLYMSSKERTCNSDGLRLNKTSSRRSRAPMCAQNPALMIPAANMQRITIHPPGPRTIPKRWLNTTKSVWTMCNFSNGKTEYLCKSANEQHVRYFTANCRNWFRQIAEANEIQGQQQHALQSKKNSNKDERIQLGVEQATRSTHAAA